MLIMSGMVQRQLLTYTPLERLRMTVAEYRIQSTHTWSFAIAKRKKNQAKETKYFFDKVQLLPTGYFPSRLCNERNEPLATARK